MGPPERNRGLGINADDSISVCDEIRIDAVAAAHEEFDTDERGRHRFLGYLLDFGGLVVYHSGDCVPYNGLADRLRKQVPQLALLPVNGRDTYRREHGVPGNMTFEEAAALSAEVGIATLIPHHFGMFAFNTIDETELCRKVGRLEESLRCEVPSLDRFYVLEN